ncbi:putative E3 ubiquitin-protein ligase TRIP12 [Wickerhamomyces ciferrii]|uniref:HECT-type E3 ubiquitin transferase n=1 Tax=Wickerhamomyces ciferrii (strain ATCC 14091 / BCRC 22168 / CBS 111 / JCM 3599 / NBRC 0793 / NRRL Y-1031 F-60-10) TaxID=1206466 RepID=K0KRP4_WICCF|nr:putative E3 ubiquitin-protein ligase TRIP12 [Wickerhamomyces ciferrii]CCH44018.1 putative E3 ubiquitin-protein ligase TRIP12 [Wickerhamomyces ciferrii]
MGKPSSSKDALGASSKKKAKSINHDGDDDVIMKGTENKEVQNNQSIDTKHKDKSIEDDDHENNDNHDEDEEHSSLLRLSENFRRFSESQRELSHNDDEINEHHQDEYEDEDLMRSIHRHQSTNQESEEDDDEDLDLADDDAINAFRSLANRLSQAQQPGSSSSRNDDHDEDRSGRNTPGSANQNPDQVRNALAENMARLFPDAMGLFGGLGGQSQASQIRGLIEGLKNRDDSFLVLETLSELSERLLMMNAPMAEREIPSFQLAEAIVDVLNEPSFMEELELQLVACRCLYNFLEVNPDYIHAAVSNGAIEALQSKLLEISYIDLAEQALQALEFISRFAGSQILRKNCLMSCLQYLDFFTIHAQRKAITITANSVKYIREYEFELVEDIFPILQRIVIEFQDPQELDDCWLAISRIIKAFRSSKSLTKLVSSELLNQMVTVISNPDTKLATNLRLIKTLSSCARNDELSIKILQSDKVGECIIGSLSKYKKLNDQSNASNSTVSIEALMAAPKELILSILDFIINLLPSESNSILTFEFTKKDYSSINKSYNEFINSIYPLLINIYSSTVVYEIRHRCMISLIRIVSSLNDINILKNPSQVINLLASIVIQNKSIIRQNKKDSKPYMALLTSLILTYSLTEKDHNRFIKEFEREGLIADTSSLLEILRSDERATTNTTENKSDENNKNDDNNDNDNDNDNDPFGDDNDDDDDDDDEDNDNEQDGSEGRSEIDEDDVEDDYDEEYDNEQERSFLYNVSDQAIFKSLTIPQLLKHLIKYASDIEQSYLSKKASGNSKLEHLRLLDEISAVLKDDLQIKNFTPNDWIQTWENLQKALGDEKNSISSFELISSGIIEILSELFQPNKFESEFQNHICRESFLKIFKDESFELLIVKLQEALSRSESFEILHCGLNSNENRVQALGKQLKLKLHSDNELDEELQNCGLNSFVALIHAISSFGTINEFIYQRIRQKRLLRSGLFSEERNIRNLSNEFHLEFSIDGEIIPYESTIFGVLFKNGLEKNPNFDANQFWNQTHQIEFKKIDGPSPKNSTFDDRYTEFDDGESDSNKLDHPITINILNLLKILNEFNDSNSSLFLNFKLTAKLNRQLEEALIVVGGIMPTWSVNIPRKYPFLFPIDTRIFFLQSTSFGYSRIIQLWNSRITQDRNGENEDNSSFNGQIPLGRPSKQKLRVDRSQLFQSLLKILDKYASRPSILEIEFVGEAGTGLGPTLEFYSNVSKEFLRKQYGLWRDENDHNDYISNANGLFPVPIREKSINKIKDHSKYFRNLGKFISRALIDNRIVDFHFNKVFFEIASSIVNKQEIPKYILYKKLKIVDPQMFKSLDYMMKNKHQLSNLTINFTLPGYNKIELIPNGTNIYVDETNFDKYIDKIVEFTLGGNVKKQIESFIIGFSEIFPYSSLTIFSSKELVEMMGNANEDWSYETIIGSIHADHGYTIDSPSVQRLIEFMTRLNKTERRLFLQFLTGSPRLPIGGFKMMRPVFTVVLKHGESGLKSDDFLPSVMTCANYLKLPDYSSQGILEERLLKAIHEGGGAFLLS